MRLTVRIDVIAIAARIAIILMAADDRSGDSAENRTRNCSGASADARKNRARKRAGSGADCRSGGGAGYCMVIARTSCTAG